MIVGKLSKAFSMHRTSFTAHDVVPFKETVLFGQSLVGKANENRRDNLIRKSGSLQVCGGQIGKCFARLPFIVCWRAKTFIRFEYLCIACPDRFALHSLAFPKLLLFPVRPSATLTQQDGVIFLIQSRIVPAFFRARDWYKCCDA